MPYFNKNNSFPKSLQYDVNKYNDGRFSIQHFIDFVCRKKPHDILHSLSIIYHNCLLENNLER